MKIKVWTEVSGRKLFVKDDTDLENIALTPVEADAKVFTDTEPAFTVRKRIIAKLGGQQIVHFNIKQGE